MRSACTAHVSRFTFHVSLWFVRRLFLFSSEVEFHAEITAGSPTTVKLKPAAVISDERQPASFVTADSPVPAIVGIADFPGKTASAGEGFVRYSADKEGKIVARIANMPHKGSATLVGSVPGGRFRFVIIAKPPEGVDLLPEGKVVRTARKMGDDLWGRVCVYQDAWFGGRNGFASPEGKSQQPRQGAF